MTSEYRTEYVTQATTKTAKDACEFPLNRTFITTTVNQNPQFNCPFNWVSSRSPNKCIGLRECKVVPPEGTIIIDFELRTDPNPIEFRVILTVRSDHTLLDILNSLSVSINQGIEAKDTEHGFYIEYINGDVVFNSTKPFFFNEGFKSLCYVMGVSYDQYKDLFETGEAIKKTINNVWDRDHLFIHSTISDDNNQILCENNSKYSPKKYLFPCTHPTFTLWFTSDGTHALAPKDCLVTLKLSFIYNFKTAAI